MGFVSPASTSPLHRQPHLGRRMRRSRAWHVPRRVRACLDANSVVTATNGGAATDALRVPDEVVAAAHEAADAAGAVIRQHFRSGLSARAKGDASPVTAADTAAEAAIRAVIQGAFPLHSVLGEEGGGEATEELSRADWAWVIDPIDGTKAFMTGKPTFGTLIAVLRRGIPVFGLIDQPVAGERWAGGAGRPATFNGTPAGVRARGPLRECVLHATTPDMFVGMDGVAFRAVAARAKHTVYGSDCYAYALLASGHVDVVVEADLKPWDFLALAPVVEAAGGVMTDWFGERIGADSDGRVVAGASHAIVGEVLEAIEKGLAPVTEFQDRGPGYVQAIAGFGEAVETNGECCISVRMRAEYHDVCDVIVRAPDVLAAHEAELSALVEQEMLRGRIVVSVEVSDVQSPSGSGVAAAAADKNAALHARKMLDEIAAAACVESTPTLADVLSIMGRLSPRTNPSTCKAKEPTIVFPLARRSVISASAALISARRRSGAALEREALERIAKINAVLEQLEKRLEDALDSHTPSGGRKEAMTPAWGEWIKQARGHTHMLAVGFMGVDGGVGMRISLLAREVVRCARGIAECANDAIIAHHALLVEEEGLALGGIGRRIR